MIRTRVLAAAHVSDALAREAWDLRLRHVALRTEVDPDEDLARFTSYLRAAGGRLATARDAAGALRGTLHMRSVRTRVEGRSVSVAVPEYGFVDEVLRGTNWIGFAAARLMVGHVLRNVGRELYLGNAAYLPSWLALRRHVPRADVFVLGDAGLPRRQERVLRWLGAELWGAGLDEDRALVRLSTQPRAAQREPRARSREAMADYLARNPDWRDGWGIMMVVRTGPLRFLRHLASPVRDSLSRMRAPGASARPRPPVAVRTAPPGAPAP